MIPLLLDELKGEWEQRLVAAGITLVPPLSAIQVAAPGGSARKLTFLVFGSGQSAPQLLLKVVRDRAQQGRLRQEFTILAELWRQERMRSTIPRPLGLFQQGARLVLAEQALPGAPLTVLLQRRSEQAPAAVSRHLRLATAWLRRFQEDDPGAEGVFPRWETVAGRLEQLPRTLGLPPSFGSDLEQLAGTFRGLPLPQVQAHGDFWPGNLFLNGEGVGVVDWEEYCPARSPLHDLFSFLTGYAHAFPWGIGRRPGRAERFRRGFLADTWLARQLSAAIRERLLGLGLPVAAAFYLYPLFLLQMATPQPDEGRKRQQQATAWQKTFRQYAVAPAGNRLPGLEV